MPLHHPKEKEKENQKKRNIKLRKIDKRKRKRSVLTCIITNSQLWNSNFCPILLFSINEYLKGNMRNITCSLHRIVASIRQRRLKDKTAEDIPQILEFGHVAWEFLLSIYELG